MTDDLDQGSDTFPDVGWEAHPYEVGRERNRVRGLEGLEVLAGVNASSLVNDAEVKVVQRVRAIGESRHVSVGSLRVVLDVHAAEGDVALRDCGKRSDPSQRDGVI